ncbi:hypothetical protein [uncultured Arcticibacterium sp.]|uniref:hypothetical protein n=1 Tax=uncultured Arcticibacterium sp. TaxID=2173042 RepID=UPI0030FB87D2
MQNRILSIAIAIIFTVNAQSFAQKAKLDSTYKKCFVGSSFFMLGNFSKTNKPDFVQLNFGYRITPKDVVSIEAKTWKYAWSLGIPPFSESYDAPEEEFPGYVREIGIALAYQRFWYKGLYTAIHVMNAKQTFVDKNGDKIKNGYQMFNTYRLGYHFELFKNRFFIEPSLAITHRPIQSKMPESFAALNDKWPNYLIGEPGLHFGFNF